MSGIASTAELWGALDGGVASVTDDIATTADL